MRHMRCRSMSAKDFRAASVDASTEASGESEEDSDDPEEFRSDGAGTPMAPQTAHQGGERLTPTAPPFIAAGPLTPPAPVAERICRSPLISKSKALFPEPTSAIAEQRVQ